MSGVSVRALDAAEYRAFRLARLVAAECTPYFMRALFAATPVAAVGLGTFAVDRHWRLYLDPACLIGENAWSTTESGAVLVHEVGHLLRDHAGRANQVARPVNLTAWNFAADAEINDDLIAAGVPLPDGAVTPAALGQPDNGLAEDYYAALVTSVPAAADGTGCGSGSGPEAVPGELPPTEHVEGAGEAPGAAAGDLVRRLVARDVTEHATTKGHGTVPAGLQRWASDVLAPPVVPWSRMLRALVRRTVARYAGRTDYSYARPSRRRVPGVVLPAMRGSKVSVAVVVDTSASMSADDLSAALAEVAGVLSASGVDRDHVHVMSCDASTGTARRVRSVRDVVLTGGGGTDMRVGIAAAQALKPSPDVVIVLTDGGTPWPDAPTRAALICAVIAPSSSGTPEWASTVHIPTTAGGRR